MTFPFASTNCNKVGTELNEPLSNLNYLNPNPETNTFVPPVAGPITGLN